MHAETIQTAYLTVLITFEGNLLNKEEKSMDLKDRFNKNLRKFFSAVYSGIQQKEIAGKIGVTPQQWNRYLKQGILPATEILEKIAVYGVSIDWLLLDTGSAFSSNDYGEAAKEKFIAGLTRSRDNSNEFEYSNKGLINELETLFGDYDAFLAHLDMQNIEYDKEALNKFMREDSFSKYEFEEMLHKLNVFYFLEHKEDDNIQDVWDIYNNVVKLNNDDYRQHREIYTVLDTVKKVVDDYFEKNEKK